MNTKLFDLYASKWGSLQEELSKIHNDDSLDVKPTNPYLISVNPDYENSDLRVMVFGQETNGWHEEGDSVEELQAAYDKWVNQGNCFSYGGQFWNGTNLLLAKLREKFPMKTIGFVANNLVKIGKSDERGFPPDYIYDIERSHFRTVPEEISILKPDIVVFYTGPNYDSILADLYEKLDFSPVTPFPSRHLSGLNINGVPHAYRTYHPNFLYRNDINTTLDTMINNISI
jgi:hypothetical protein